MDWLGSGLTCFKEHSWHSHEASEETHEKPKSGLSVTLPKTRYSFIDVNIAAGELKFIYSL
jgi:hypothetical protein